MIYIQNFQLYKLFFYKVLTHSPPNIILSKSCFIHAATCRGLLLFDSMKSDLLYLKTSSTKVGGLSASFAYKFNSRRSFGNQDPPKPGTGFKQPSQYDGLIQELYSIL